MAALSQAHVPVELVGEEIIECSQCEGLVADDRAVHITRRDERFCDKQCLQEWIEQHTDVVADLIED